MRFLLSKTENVYVCNGVLKQRGKKKIKTNANKNMTEYILSMKKGVISVDAEITNKLGGFMLHLRTSGINRKVAQNFGGSVDGKRKSNLRITEITER